MPKGKRFGAQFYNALLDELAINNGSQQYLTLYVSKQA